MFTYDYLHSQCSLTYKGRRAAMFCGFLLLLSGQAKAQMGLGLSPMRVEFPATAGRAFSGTLMLSNTDTRGARVKTEILDFYVDENQTPQFVPNAPAEAEYSCKRWITVNPMEPELTPKGQLAVRYTVRVPMGALERSYHCAIGFLGLPPADEFQGVGVRTAFRVVAAIYPVVGKPAIQGQISQLQLEPVVEGGARRWRSVLTMENTGQMLFRPIGKVELIDGSGRVVEAVTISAFPALPQRKQRYMLPFKSSIAGGTYTLKAHVDVGSEVQEASAEVVAEGTGQ